MLLTYTATLLPLLSEAAAATLTQHPQGVAYQVVLLSGITGD